MIVCGITVDKTLSFRQEIDIIPIFNFFDRPTDRPTDRQTDIATYRAAIAAKKKKKERKQWLQVTRMNVLGPPGCESIRMCHDKQVGNWNHLI